jgi:hypothetical protein
MAYASQVALVGTANVNPLNLTAGTTFDGITPTSGQRILLVGQTTTSQNGVWIYNGTGASHPMTRPGGTDQYATTNPLDNAVRVPVADFREEGGMALSTRRRAGRAGEAGEPVSRQADTLAVLLVGQADPNCDGRWAWVDHEAPCEVPLADPDNG